MQDLAEILKLAEAAIHASQDLATLEGHRIHYLGKKGVLTLHLKNLGKLPAEERPLAGKVINDAKETIQQLIDDQATQLKKNQVIAEIKAQSLDVTLPGRGQECGTFHPVSQTIAELRRIFTRMGFVAQVGPEIEDDYHNFAALNIEALHPARTMHDTFYFPNGMLLRTHMSPVQIRAMQKMSPPLRIIAMGRVYRRDFDLSHTPMFHQLECLLVDETVSFAHLKGLLTHFLREFFSDDVVIRFRPAYFPFTEPSAEVDIRCVQCKGKGCRLCKHSGWLEILGAGLVHPKVFTAVNIDPQRFKGLAFGAGIDRLALLKYGISDLRSLFENDVRFLQQF